MKQSQIFSKTRREIDQEEISQNAQLLTKAGFIEKLFAGVYSFLPLGLKVLSKVEKIIREEMDAVGGQEVLMPALHPRENWDKTGRWDKVDILFKLKGCGDRDLALGPTHEEVVTPLVGNFIQSYRQLPIAVYQLQTKFRNEARAKSGILRCREFRMKDMYSFHATQEDLDNFYEKVKDAYLRIYQRCGIGEQTYVTAASGGIFSKYSHEFQTLTESGEDIVYLLPGDEANQRFAINKEIVEEEEVLDEFLPKDSQGNRPKLIEQKAIEVGNIFKLGSKFSDDFDLKFLDEDGLPQKILMGCYGIGPSRLIGTIAECLADSAGLVWPLEVAPFQFHLISLLKEPKEIEFVDNLYTNLKAKGFEVLYDDRTELRPGEKFVDSDLLGIPHRLVISAKTLKENSIEYKSRTSKEPQLLTIESFLNNPKQVF